MQCKFVQLEEKRLITIKKVQHSKYIFHFGKNILNSESGAKIVTFFGIKAQAFA